MKFSELVRILKQDGFELIKEKGQSDIIVNLVVIN